MIDFVSPCSQKHILKAINLSAINLTVARDLFDFVNGIILKFLADVL